MKRLFIELYLDEDVSALVAKLLRVRGFTVQTTQEAGRTETDDDKKLYESYTKKWIGDQCKMVIAEKL